VFPHSLCGVVLAVSMRTGFCLEQGDLTLVPQTELAAGIFCTGLGSNPGQLDRLSGQEQPHRISCRSGGEVETIIAFEHEGLFCSRIPAHGVAAHEIITLLAMAGRGRQDFKDADSGTLRRGHGGSSKVWSVYRHIWLYPGVVARLPHRIGEAELHLVIAQALPQGDNFVQVGWFAGSN